MQTISAPGPTNQELLKRIFDIQSDPLNFLMEMSQRFGDVAGFSVANLPVLILSHPDGVRHVLQDEHRRYNKDTIQYNALATITGKGLLTNDGASWLRQRRLAQPAFARPRLMALDEIVVPATQRMLQAWQAAAKESRVIDVDQEMMRLTLEIVGKALFSIDLHQEAGQLTRAVLAALDHIMYRARSVFAPPNFIPTPRNLRFRRALRILDRSVLDMIEARKRADNAGDDLLGMFLKARDADTGEPMDTRQVRDEVMTMLIAGHETVASALTWTWMLLSLHPHEREAARDEVRRVLGKRPPTAADLEHLPHLNRLFSESLRLFPPAWVISRKAVQPDEIMGYPVAANSLVIISPYVVHRRGDFWEQPEQFQPDRFEQDLPNRFAYLPFGAGPRLCIGHQFAMLEAQLIIAQILQHFVLDLASNTPVRIDPLVTLRPVGGLHMHVRSVAVFG